MTLEFDAERHQYRMNGEIVPSVTHICRFLNYDAAEGNVNKWLRDYAADRGTRIHAYCTAVDYGEELDEVDADCVGYVEAYIRFLRDFKPTWAGIERIVVNKYDRYAGTIDRYGTMKGIPVVLDIKTGSQINHAYCAAQLQLYNSAMEFDTNDQGDCVSRKRVVLHLSGDGTYKLIDVTDLPFDISDACLTLNKFLTFKGESL